MRYYSAQTGTTYIDGQHVAVPGDAVPISEERYESVISNPPPGKIRSHDTAGLPILIDPPPYVPTSAELCQRIDTAADSARRAVAGDPLRAVEYDLARQEAEAFAVAGYQGEVPRMVAAWAIGGRTPRQAADSILAEAAAYTEALYLIRETRLQAKERIRGAMEGGDLEYAQACAAQAVAAIGAAVFGVGNNAEVQ